LAYVAYLVPVFIMLMGLTAETIIEISAELSTATLIESDPGVPLAGVAMLSDGIVDMRPESALPADEAGRSPGRPQG
jgi:hypothetical protein